MIDIDILEFPISLILAVVFILSIYLFFKSTKAEKIVGFISSPKFSVILLGILSLFLMIEGTWGVLLHKSICFLFLVFLLMVSLALVTLKGLKSKSLVYIFSHLGLFLVLYGGFFGAPDFKDCQIAVGFETPSHVARTVDGKFIPLPFEITLKDFQVDYYEDGVSPKQYTSTFFADGKTYSTSVNHPCRVKGCLIYQADYDRERGEYSILKLVKDPWIPIIYLGMILLALSAVLQAKTTWRSKATLPAVIVLAVLFSILSLARINLGTLMPALRSLWFIPHIVIYMLAYSVLAVSVVLALVSFYKKSTFDLSYKLLQTSSCLLLVGMLCGAVWAKAAWGDYWAWDPKENWAAATWLLTLLGSHIPNRNKNKVVVIVSILVAFFAIQMTWYGVNYLPSSSISMHTYNR